MGFWVAVCVLVKISSVAYDNCTLDTVTGNLAVNSVFITVRSMRETNKFHFFSFFFETLFYTVSFTMVIKRSPGGESAGASLKSTFVVLACTLTTFGDRLASIISKFNASVNSDLGNGSFWVEIRDAEPVNQCS